MLKNFKVNVALRQISLVLVMLAFFYCLYYTNFYVTTFILLIIAGSLFWNTVNYMDKTNADFTAFLMGIQYEDFSATYSGYHKGCLLYTSPSPRDATLSRMPSSA